MKARLRPGGAELPALDRHEHQHDKRKRREPPHLRRPDAEASEGVGRRESGDHPRHDRRAVSAACEDCGEQGRGGGERTDDAELVPELEQDRARGVRGQKPLEASAQRGLESVPGDQPLRLAGDDRAPDAQRAEKGMALRQDEPGDRAEDERNQRRQCQEPGAEPRRHDDAEPAGEHRQHESHGADREGDRRVRLRPEHGREPDERTDGERLEMASARPQPGDAGPDQEGEDGQAAVEVLGDDLDPARPRRAEQRDEAADERRDADPDRDQVKVRGAHPVGEGEIADERHRERRSDVQKALRGLRRKRRPEEGQDAPGQRERGGDPGRRGRDLTGRPSDRALSAVDRGGDRDEEDADRDENDEAAPGHERRRRHDQDQRREADAPQQSGGLRGRIGGGGRDARHQKSVEDRRAERQPSGAP